MKKKGQEKKEQLAQLEQKQADEMKSRFSYWPNSHLCVCVCMFGVMKIQKKKNAFWSALGAKIYTDQKKKCFLVGGKTGEDV